MYVPLLFGSLVCVGWAVWGKGLGEQGVTCFACDVDQFVVVDVWGVVWLGCPGFLFLFDFCKDFLFVCVRTLPRQQVGRSPMILGVVLGGLSGSSG